MKRVLLSLVFVLSMSFAGVYPSAAESDHELFSGGPNFATKFISKGYGGEIRSQAYNKRFQGFQVDTRLFQVPNWVFLTETSYSRSGAGDNLKTWVFDSSAKAVLYTKVNQQIKLFVAPSMGIVSARVRNGTDDMKGTELSWGGHTGAELSHGRLSLILTGSYRSIDEYGSGMAFNSEANVALSEKVFLTAGFGYDWASHLTNFSTGLGFRPFGVNN